MPVYKKPIVKDDKPKRKGGAPKGNKFALGHDGSNAGAKPKPVLEDEIYKLAKIHCTNPEIASMCDISVDTLERKYAGILEKGRENGKASLRRQQVRLIEEQNSTQMAIWLGKVYLKQKEEVIIQTQELPPLDIPLASENQRKKK